MFEKIAVAVAVAVAVADADALIALALEKDPNHTRAVNIATMFLEQQVEVIFPVTVFPEAITSLIRAANQPQKAHLINRQMKQGTFHVEYLNQEILQKASEFFEKSQSKKNTFFDAIVAATADKLNTKTIFSFDSWYQKLGFSLAKSS